MKNIKFIIGVIIGLLIAGYSIAQAVPIAVPSTPGNGYMLVSTSTGAYIATTTDPAHFGSIYATSTATSTFSGGINVTSGCLSVNGTCIVGGGGGSGTVNSGTTGQFPYYASNGTAVTATSSIFLATNQNVGIGSSSPATLFSVAGSGYFTGGVGVGISNPSTNTVNLASGGSYQINGTSVLNGSTLGSGVTGSSLTSVGTIVGGTWTCTTIAVANGGTNNTSTYTAGSVIFSNGTSLTQNNSQLFWDNVNNRLGIASTSPNQSLSVQTNAYIGGNLGIGTSTPATGLTIENKNVTLSKSQIASYWASTTISSGLITPNFNSGNMQRFLLNGSATLNLDATSTNAIDGTNVLLKICNDSTGSRVLTFGAAQANRFIGITPATSTMPTVGNSCLLLGASFDQSALMWQIASTTGVWK